MAMNKLFQTKPEMINYDYYDVAEGTGYVVYYGLKGDNGEYMTSTISSIYSEEICTWQRLTVSVNDTKYFDVDFDIVFNRPKNVKGKLLANIPIGCNSQSTATRHIKYYVICKAYHVSLSAVETLLATGTSVVIDHDLINGNNWAFTSNIMCCIMNLSAIRHFKAGEKLRFTIEGYFQAITDGATLNLILAHDPANRIIDINNLPDSASKTYGVKFANGNSLIDFNYTSTQMSFHVPMVLDV